MSDYCKQCLAASRELYTQLFPREGECPDHRASPDLVSAPPHYTSGGVETIDFIEAKGLGFALGNVVKYVSRAGKKSAATLLEDLRKARWYLDREIARLEGAK